MKIAATLLPEFDQEMKTTRKVLERVPTQGNVEASREIILDRSSRAASFVDARMDHEHAHTGLTRSRNSASGPSPRPDERLPSAARYSRSIAVRTYCG